MYESPINMEYENPIYNAVQKELELNVLLAVQKIHISVDRDELIRALQYDRQQYEKGYADGYYDGLKKAMEDEEDD